MEKLALKIIKRRKYVLSLFISLALICGAMVPLVQVNYNIVEYLPKDAQSTTALKLMEEEFDGEMPTTRVMAQGTTLQEALLIKERIKNVQGVSVVMWLDDVLDLKTPLETADQAIVEGYYKGGTAVFQVGIDKGHEVEVIREIRTIVGEDGAIAGEAADRAAMQDMAFSETMGAVAIVVPAAILLLILFTSSWIEPFLYLVCIGVAVLMNMGSNAFTGEVSFITRTVSPVLQLAVSLDYAIFLLHSFNHYRKETLDVEKAMAMAMKRSFSAISASAATTFFGFIALVFMRFEIGADLGLNLVKGILLTFISVMVFLPCLTLSMLRPLDRFAHKRFIPEWKGIGNVVKKVRWPMLILVAVLIVPCFLAQSRNDFTYGLGDPDPDTKSGHDTLLINETFGQSIPLVALVKRGDPAREAMLAKALGEIDEISEVVSYTAMVGASIPGEFLNEDITKQFYSKNYARIILYADMEKEGDAAFSVVERVRETISAHYGAGEGYSLGESANLYDMKEVVTGDNAMINLFAIISITLTLLVTFRSLTLPLILLMTIEMAIFVNLSVSYFTGTSLSYIGYLIISTVQLGATVDYAILLSDHYMVFRKTMGKKAAIEAALREGFQSILLSGGIMTISGFCLAVTSTNVIVKELGVLLARGTMLSMVSVIFFLPALLHVFDGAVGKTTLRAGFR
ncbi:MMPL family transporter [Christensenellaceae bacterium OttesenSCG-928-M15]|nr:MMPL family transporter [Christensenellaceae bacterium OttesenSCG-928-M15]